MSMMPADGGSAHRSDAIHPTAWRGCMKSGSRKVFRYSSTHEKALPDGFIRCRMEIHRTSPTSAQRTRSPQDPQPSRDPERHLLPPAGPLHLRAAQLYGVYM